MAVAARYIRILDRDRDRVTAGLAGAKRQTAVADAMTWSSGGGMISTVGTRTGATTVVAGRVEAGEPLAVAIGAGDRRLQWRDASLAR